MADIERDHHTVPWLYLNGFANEDRQLGGVLEPVTPER